MPHHRQELLEEEEGTVGVYTREDGTVVVHVDPTKTVNALW